MNSRKVKSIHFPRPNDGVQSGNGCSLVLETFFHGTWDDQWVLNFRNGIEVERYNVQYIETIVFDQEDGEAA